MSTVKLYTLVGPVEVQEVDQLDLYKHQTSPRVRVDRDSRGGGTRQFLLYSPDRPVVRLEASGFGPFYLAADDAARNRMEVSVKGDSQRRLQAKFDRESERNAALSATNQELDSVIHSFNTATIWRRLLVALRGNL